MGGASVQSGSPLPSPTLPKGGGAIRGIGEKFSANPATGAGALDLPIFTSPGRGGFHPTLALQYDTTKGNGPFGIGWSLSVPRVTRRTDKGLPRYDDSDTFILSGAEDLVPALKPTSSGWVPDEAPASAEYVVRRYRPRVESLYARIERWTRRSDGDVHWRSITRDNITSIYGRSTTARIADPENPRHIFSWLLEETRDGTGNVIAYEYKPEDQKNLDGTVGHERPRSVANAYLKRIYYGNQTPDVADDWHFQVLFDYGEHDASDPINGPLGLWPGRQDPFSDFRSTFEVRTYRLCRRILMLHDFAELGEGWTVVRSTDIDYAQNPISTYLHSVTQRGWVRRPDGSYDRSTALPPLELGYSQPKLDPEIHILDPKSAENLPIGIDAPAYQMIDLDSEGLPGVLTQQAGAFFYKRNDGDGQFGPIQTLATKPSVAEMGGGFQQVTDLDGSGGKFLVQLGREPQGYFERHGDSWDTFRPFERLPNLDFGDAALRYLDLDGDGLPDILKPEGELFRWWGSLGRDGYGAEHRVPQPRDDDKGPYVVWTDPRQAIVIADMTGDGLPDIVRVRNGAVDYWPNRGYGRFGAKVTMRNVRPFTRDDLFNPAYLRLADIDGSGTADLLYLEDGVARIWMNQAGNGYGDEQRVPLPSPAGASVAVADLLGKGTACLVWSSPLPGHRGRQLRYLDLMSGTKPHLLVSIDNHLGATTTIDYKPSTAYYLEDRKAGRPWVTKLPFPVHVVARIEVDEAVTGAKLVSTYRYSHGHYDGIEREFAGFGFVEQEDAEAVQVGHDSPEHYTPPRRTRSWFHTGAYFDAETISTQYAHEYSPDFPQLVPDSLLPPGVAPEEAREAARALRGHLLRQEVYGLDGPPLESHPYVVTESNFEIRRLQPKAGNRYGVFCVHPRETLTAHTERHPDDPRLEHELVLTVDDFGNVRESVHIAYPRRSKAEPGQDRLLVTDAQRDFLLLTDAPDHYRVDLVRESRTYELTGLPPPNTGPTYQRSEIITFLSGDPTATPPQPHPVDIDFSTDSPPSAPARRLIERTAHLYLGDQPADEELLALGLPTETRRAALTPALVDRVYQALVTDPNARRKMLDDNKYEYDAAAGLWCAPSGHTEYAQVLFYQAQRFTDPFGNVSSVDYDDYALAVTTSNTAVGTSYATAISVETDYRVLAPSLITDANGNRSRAAFDALGRVTKAWRMGKPGEQVGDDDAHPSTRLEYHLEAIPAYVYLEKREAHGYDAPTNDKLQRAYTYSDGLGREVLTKKQAEPDDSGAERWVGSGRTVFDNKGNPVKKYEPYFSPTPAYEVVFAGVSDLLRYDPLDRVIRAEHPNGSYRRIEFDAWTQTTYDENDTVGEPNNRWYQDATTGPNATTETKEAAQKALAHKDTPTTLFIDPLGRTILTQQHNRDADGADALYRTTVELDIQGNPRAVTDARLVPVATHLFDMLGRRLFAHSVDAGDATVLPDALGAVVREWNPNHIQIARDYDPLRRPLRVWVTDRDGKRLAERTFYGETLKDGADHNLRGRVYRRLDGAGLITHAYDFKGNVVLASRRLATRYDAPVAWPDLPDLTTTAPDLQVPGLDTEAFDTTTAYDALDRVTRLQVPGGTRADGTTVGDHVAVPTYNEAARLETMSVQFAGAASPTLFVADIDYNEKGQRTRIVYGNGVRTEYDYEPDTFRLSKIKTFKTPSTTKPDLQALSYTYDPVGNITTIEDEAQQTYFVGNSIVKPTAKYTYDAIYRLTNALGREHSGQAVMDQTFTPKGVPFPSPNDPQAMRNYAQKYDYDEVGNFLRMTHQVPDSQGRYGNAWTRTYTPDTKSNRLLRTVVGDESSSTAVVYLHDDAGNITKMQAGSLPTLDWDYRNQLVHAVSSRGDSYFTYDASGQRVRKVLVKDGTLQERIYIGAYEIYRERPVGSDTATLERRTLHVNDDKRRIALAEFLVVGEPATSGSINDGPAELIRYQLDNHLGSATLEVDGVARLLSYEEYHPYGTTAYRARDGLIKRSHKRYSFTAKERDEETGLYYFGARYYSPSFGRWISPDPSGLDDSPNAYSYVHHNPLRYRDPDGERADDAVGPSVAEGLRAYGISIQTYAIETFNRTHRTAFAAARAALTADKWNANAVRHASIGPGRAGTIDTIKQFFRGLFGSGDQTPPQTLDRVLRTPYSVELVKVPNDNYEEQFAHFVAAANSKTPTATRIGAAVKKAAGVSVDVLSLILAAPAAGRLARAIVFEPGAPRIIAVVRDEAYTISRHTRAGTRVLKDLARGREAHVFNEGIDLASLEKKVLTEGTYQGKVRGFERFTYTSDTPIGTRIQPGKPDVPLNTVELKGRVDESGVFRYHLVPRTRPAR